MPSSRLLTIAIALLTLAGPVGAMPAIHSAAMDSSATVVLVQAAPATDQGRNCQTLRTCQYAKGGSFRGCVSSYSCRSCRFVPDKCSVGSVTGKCQKLVCDWGG